MRIKINNCLLRYIEKLISASTNYKWVVKSVYAVIGGDINQAYCIRSADQKYFVKLNALKYLEMFKAEAKGLALLASTQSFKVPRVVVCDSFEKQCFLVLEYLDLSGPTNITNFAQSLAKLHQQNSQQQKQSEFGLDQDNFIGLTAQKNNFSANWAQFFAEQRLGFQCELLKAKGIKHSVLDPVESVIQTIDAFFIDYQASACLLHGDLWQGNYGFDPSGKAIIYDPACYYGDHEVDLAMLELFGHPGQSFFSAYDAVYPIDPGYQRRKHLYNLYHILNHANLFAGGYVNQAQRMAIDLLHMIR
ncbi:MAG: fructosamine kinase family protein [Enterobacterales bacterium]|nr:fructosamine kinase family protein [Enterobacterales bacterium]